MKKTPMDGFSIMLVSVSIRLFPGRSGIKIVFSSRTCTKPGWSPLGDTSDRPPLLVPIHKKGERAIKSVQ